jgi:hypothetical protein
VIGFDYVIKLYHVIHLTTAISSYLSSYYGIIPPPVKPPLGKPPLRKPPDELLELLVEVLLAL